MSEAVASPDAVAATRDGPLSLIALHSFNNTELHFKWKNDMQYN